MHSVFCIENPLMDYIMAQDYPWLESFGARPGTMQLVPYDTFSSLVAKASAYQVVPGGSGANTIRVLSFLLGKDANLLGRPAYAGAVGRDEAASRFSQLMKVYGVDLALAEKDLPTGVSGIVVTPDHERTMFTYLGACRDYGPEDIEWSFLKDCRFFYSTGYMWDTEPQLAALHAVVDKAFAWGIPCCFDLADPFVVDRYYKELGDWLKGRFAIVFGNRDELSRMTDCVGSDEDIINRASDLAPLVVMKLGKKGCLISSDGLSFSIPGEVVAARDTTGAGDAFAAGFLYGLLRKLDLEDCGRLANRVASRIVQVDGCAIESLDRGEILSCLPAKA